jgi:hypothetical protein
MVEVDAFAAAGISSVRVSIWARPVRSQGERRDVPARPARGRSTMTQYLLSVHSVDGEVGDPMTEEEMQQSWKQIQVLNQELKSAGVWVFSGRLHDPDTATVVRMSDGEVVTTDGPFVEAREHLGGFYIIQAKDLDAALAWASKVTAAVGKPIEVWPFAATEA